MTDRPLPTNSTAVASIAPPQQTVVADFVAETEAETINPLVTIGRLMRGRWAASLILATIIGALLSVAVLTVIKPGYRSEGLVRIIAREPRILTASRDDSRLRLFDAFVSSEATYIQSRKVLERAFERFKANHPEASFDAFQNGVEVKKLKGLISVAGGGSTPEQAADSVNSVLDAYSILTVEQSDTRSNLRVRELDGRIDDLRDKQARVDRELLAVGGEYDRGSLQKAHLSKVQELEELDKRLAEINNSLAEIEANNGALDADTGDMEIKRATLLDRAMADMVFERAKRAADLEEMTLRYQDEHPKVQRLTASLQVIDDAIETRRRLIATLGKTGAITGTDGSAPNQSLAELAALRDKLQGRRGIVSAEAVTLNGKLIDMKRLGEERSEIAKMLAQSRRILDEARLESRNSLPGVAEILSRGSNPTHPHNDKSKPIALLGGVGGFGGVLVASLLLGLINSRARFSDDLASALEIPTYALPYQASPGDFDRLLCDLEFNPAWRHDRATVLCLTRQNPQTPLPLAGMLTAAKAHRLKTLIILAGSDALAHDRGFIDYVRHNPKSDGPYPLVLGDIVPYGTEKKSFSPKMAADWIGSLTGHYDLIIVYAGMMRADLASQILPKLADLSIAITGVGDSISAIGELKTMTPSCAAILVNAPADDPAFDHADDQGAPLTYLPQAV